MKRKLFAIGLASVLLLAGCGGGGGLSGNTNASQGASSAGYPDYDSPEETYWDMGLNGEAAPASPAGEDSSVYQNAGAKLIRRAELHIQTERFDESEAALQRLVAECGGYFELASVYGGGQRDANANRWGEYTVRVPAEKYSQFFNSSGELGYVTSSTERSEDVGEVYYDIEARLKTQRTKQERLLSLLEKAATMEDIISLENALSDTEYQIEQYSSELNRYDALIGFSTFNLYLNEVGRVSQAVGETASLGERMAAGVQSSFQGLVQGGQNLLIWVSYNLFLTIILLGVAVAVVVVGKRELKKLQKQSGTDNKTEE